MDLTLSELEQAINFWRGRRPSTGEERRLSPEVDKLATVYALMIHERANAWPLERLDAAARELFDSWKAQQGR